MELEEKKISIIQKLLFVEEESILDRIEEMLNTSGSGLSDEQKKAIDEGLLSLKRGTTYTHEKVMNMVKEKFPKYFK